MKEIKSLLRLAIPLVFMQLGMVMFGTVDTLFMGRVGAAALGGVGMAHSTMFMLFIFGTGNLLGIDALSSRAMGAGDQQRSISIFIHALLLALCVAFPLILFLHFAEYFYNLVGVDAKVSDIAVHYLKVSSWMILPGLLFTACRQYLQSLGITRPLLIAMIVANFLNIFLNDALIFGHFGFPALGYIGCAVATIVANILLFLITGSAILLHLKGVQFSMQQFQFQKQVIKDLIRLGVPAGLQTFIEVSVFSVVATLIGKFSAQMLAAHQVTISLASITFMVPLGISYATAVKVGHALGAKNFQLSIKMGTYGMLLGIAFMSFTCLLFYTVPKILIGIYTVDPEVYRIGFSLLKIAAFFQVFDGFQVVLTGVLRGLGDTKISMIANFLGHWCFGFPLGVILAFHYGMQAKGLWIGLSIGLMSVAAILYFIWLRKIRQLLTTNTMLSV